MQTILAYGDRAQRQKLINDLLPIVLSIAQHDFSHFLLSKLFIYGDKKQRSQYVAFLFNIFMLSFISIFNLILILILYNRILTKIQGHVMKLFRGKFGAKVIQQMYEIGSESQRRRLVAEFYGREIALFQDTESKKSLSQYLSEQSKAKQHALLQEMKEKLVSLLSSKGEAVIGHAVLHRVIWDYLRYYTVVLQA